MLYQVNNRSFFLREGDALFGNSGTLHTGAMYENQDCEYLSITFDPKLIYGYDNSIIYTNYVKPIIQNPALPAIHFDRSAQWQLDAIHLITEITQLEAEKNPTYELDITTRLLAFWKLLFIHKNLTYQLYFLFDTISPLTSSLLFFNFCHKYYTFNKNI